ncbi:MAG TPA: hypothetical protein DCR13_05550 [Gammaproteobacteria bacterium]|nr:hypothetical protein [Gammaproteobacteria bacterium]
MELVIQDINPDAIDVSLDKAKQYRSLLEPEIAESICLDILHIVPEHQATLTVYILALSDQIQKAESRTQIREIKAAIERLTSQYERHYYTGIFHERRARFLLRQPMSRSFAYSYFEEAVVEFSQAQELSRNKNCDSILRKNSCIRTIIKEKLKPRKDSEDILFDRES